MGFLSSSTFLKSLKFIFLSSAFLIVLKALLQSYLRGIMLVYAMMLRISLAEQQSSLSMSFDIYDFERSQGMSFMFISSISFLDQESGFPRQIILLKRLLAAVSSSLGKLVAPITRTSPLLGLLMPSIKTRNQVFRRLEAQFSFSDRAVSMESISSMKMMLGASCQAAAKILLIIFYDYPTYLFMIEEAERAKKVHSDYLAKALQRYVFPFPGGPQRRIPLGGDLMPVNRSGLCRGLITASSKIIFTQFRPTTSLKPMSSFFTISYYTAGWMSTFIFQLCFFLFFSGYLFGGLNDLSCLTSYFILASSKDTSLGF